MNNKQDDQSAKPSSNSWQDLGKQYGNVGIAAVAAALEIFEAREQKPAKRKTTVRYLGNSAA